MNIFALIATIALLVGTSQSLSLILVRMEPYCFTTFTEAARDLKFNYVISGINEDQVTFRVPLTQLKHVSIALGKGR